MWVSVQGQEGVCVRSLGLVTAFASGDNIQSAMTEIQRGLATLPADAYGCREGRVNVCNPLEVG